MFALIMELADKIIEKGARYIGFGEEQTTVNGEAYVFHFNWKSHHNEPSFNKNCNLLSELLQDTGSEATSVVAKDYNALSKELERSSYVSLEKDGEIVTADLLEKQLWDTWTFLCRDRQHATEYSQHDPAMLEKLRMLTPYEAMTILILGGIGVGKSTFINVLVNYFAYEPLDALKTKPLSWFIPFSFSVQQPDPKNPNWKFIEFMITEKENEISGQGRPMSSLKDVSDPGQSSTQKTMVYSAQIGNTTLRLFDTPGISDIRGMAVDELKMGDIYLPLETMINSTAFSS
ncbi:hypothetical protein EX30DRAFT_378623 [Ascodesmis nigricans]|uniref:DUF7656 domain-containing protein n=1 Tax=Ascodesmis nigricans TaxID=341454 RepID=A0A4S2MW17_9PEZI|nr:hypothetical protein EX30DRAFT_378623 [Ascodesmis nigricans]